MGVEKNNSKKSQVTLVTHSGNFHSDDVFGVATLCLLLEKDHEIEIIRTRDQQQIDKADYVIDTGNIYDPEKNRFDHHQKEGAGSREGVPYASFGLVWKEYGEALCKDTEVAKKIERTLVFPIDARDNGVDIATSIYPNITNYDIRDIVILFRNTWKEGESVLYQNFIFLVDLAKKIIAREIIYERDSIESDHIIRNIHNESPDKRILILDRWYDWKAIVCTLSDVLLVVYPKLQDNTWGVQTGRDNLNSVKARIELPASWAGKKGNELEQATNVAGSLFCHRNRFLAVTETKEAALALAHIALKEAGK